MDNLVELLSQLNDRMTKIEAVLIARSQNDSKEWYSVAETADALGKARFTVREWCRHGRINCQKRASGRGAHSEWMISREEIERYQNEGLLRRCSP